MTQDSNTTMKTSSILSTLTEVRRVRTVVALWIFIRDTFNTAPFTEICRSSVFHGVYIVRSGRSAMKRSE
jgi:hypothetical protein